MIFVYDLMVRSDTALTLQAKGLHIHGVVANAVSWSDVEGLYFRGRGRARAIALRLTEDGWREKRFTVDGLLKVWLFYGRHGRRTILINSVYPNQSAVFEELCKFISVYNPAAEVRRDTA